jgi:hypothetical protein
MAVKNPGSADPDSISPKRGGFYHEKTNGILKWWKNGILGKKSG